MYHYRGIKEYRIRVTRSTLQHWVHFASGNLPDPNNVQTPPLVTVQGSTVVANSVEITCVEFYGVWCALQYFEIGYL